MGFFKKVGGFFKSVFTDILPPVVLGIAGGPTFGPFLAAAYSGIKTGIETGSPFAGIGSAAMSFAGSKIGYGLDAKAAPVGPLGGTSPIDATKGYASFMGSQTAEGGLKGALARGVQANVVSDVGLSPRFAESGFKQIADASGNVTRIIRPDLVSTNVAGDVIADQTSRQILKPTSGIMGFAKDAFDVATKPAPLFKNIAGIDTGINYEMRPATLAGLGFVAKQAGTPLPEPEPLPLMQQQPQTDFSKYAYKGPLQRGEYQYADPESLYRERDTSTYGYVGAKEGGVMKFQLGGAPMIGGFSPIDPNMRPAPSLQRTGGEFPVNIMSPPGGQADPVETINFIGPSPINQPPMSGITQTLQKAGQQQPGMPTPSPTQTLQGLSQQLSKDVNLQPPAPMPAQAPMMPQQQLDVQGLLDKQSMNKLSNIIRDLPRKPLDISISGLGSLGLAAGGQVPGMAGASPISQTAMSPIAPQQSPTIPAQERPKNLTIGQSSTMDPTAVETTKAVYGEGDDPGEEEFINMLNNIANSNSNVFIRGAMQKAIIPQIGKQIYQDMKQKDTFTPGLPIQQPTIPAISEDKEPKQMNIGGEVPGMEKELPAGTTGPSSTVDMSAVNYGKSTPGLRQRFDDEIIGVYENMFSNKGKLLGGVGKLIGQMMIDQQGDAMFKYAQDNNLLRGLGGTYQGPLQRGPYRYPSSAKNLAMGKEDVSKIGYENVTYPGVEKMKVDYYNQGGEVESGQMLQENAFVIPADVVGHIGDGSSDAGAQRLQQFLGMNPQQYQAGGIMAGELQGPGGGMDDLIQTSIEGKQAAAVSPQEFVVPRDIVAELGKGSYDQGSKKLYALMRNVRKFKTGKTEQPAELNRGLNTLMRSAVA